MGEDGSKIDGNTYDEDDDGISLEDSMSFDGDTVGAGDEEKCANGLAVEDEPDETGDDEQS